MTGGLLLPLRLEFVVVGDADTRVDGVGDCYEDVDGDMDHCCGQGGGGHLYSVVVGLW